MFQVLDFGIQYLEYICILLQVLLLPVLIDIDIVKFIRLPTNQKLSGIRLIVMAVQSSKFKYFVCFISLTEYSKPTQHRPR